MFRANNHCIIWPPDAKCQFIGKDRDAGKDWRQKEKGAAEDGMASLTQWTWIWANSRRQWRTEEDWCAAVYGVTKHQTWLSDWRTTTTFYFLVASFFSFTWTLFLNIYLNKWIVARSSVWDLVTLPGIEPGPPALGARSLRPWTTREVPGGLLFEQATLISFSQCKGQCLLSKT